MQTLKQLQDYASTTDNVWLCKKLQDLEREMDLVIHNARMKVYDDLIGMVE